MDSQLQTVTRSLSLQPEDTRRLASLCGQLDEHLKLIERQLGVEIYNRGNSFQLMGDEDSVKTANHILEDLYRSTQNQPVLTPNEVHLALKEVDVGESKTPTPNNGGPDTPGTLVRIKRSIIKPRGENQRQYVQNIYQHDINFGVGPAGTGKTYLAVACAVNALEQDRVRRIVLVRPAVEAGEKLGFLPGDMAQKVDPYLRPLYDALYEMLGFEKVARLIERNIIEVAPLAYMRGRTLNDAFIILDESQNTTQEQMKMFLTRIGFGSCAVVTGDVTQIDLPQGKKSGLVHAIEVLKEIKDISFIHFAPKDVVRHNLVQKIVEAYDEFNQPASSHEAGVNPTRS